MNYDDLIQQDIEARKAQRTVSPIPTPAAKLPALDYDALIRAERADRDVRFKVAVQTATATDPDRAARHVQQARQLGYPVAVVEADPKAAERDARARRIDVDTAAAPVLRERIARDESFAKVAHDDTAALAKVEQHDYTFGNALKKGVAGAKLTLDFLALKLAEAAGADTAETQAILNKTASVYIAQGSDKNLQAAGERAKAAGGSTWYRTLLHLPNEIAAGPDSLATVGKFLVEQLPGSLAGFGLGAVVTAPTRAVVVSRITNAATAAGVNAGLAGAAGNATAVVLTSLGTNYVEGKERGLSDDEASARAIQKTAAELPANVLAGAALGVRFGGALRNTTTQAAVQGAGGGAGAAMAARAVGEEADPVEIALEILGEAVGAVPEVVALGVNRIKKSRAAQTAQAAEQAQDDAKTLTSMAAAADASRLKKRDPLTFSEYVGAVQPDAAVWVAPEHLAGVDLSPVPHVAAALAEAQTAGGEVRITIADLLTHLPAAALVQHVRTRPEAMTADEAKRATPAVDLDAEVSAFLAGVEKPAPGEGRLLTGADLVRMSEPDFAAYQQAAVEYEQAAIEYRDRRNLSDLRWLANRKDEALSQVQQQATAARITIEREVIAEVQAQPVYAAQRFLATAEGKAMLPDLVAERFGFDSGDTLIDAILKAQPEAEVVEGMTDTRMLEEHPDIADAIGQARSAEALIAERARERFLATEANALARATGSKLLMAKEARAYAEQAIARRSVRASTPRQFVAAASRAGRNAEEAFHRGETALAAKYKRSQVSQHALASEARAAQDDIARSLKDFRAVVERKKDPTRDQNLGDLARSILAQYGLAETDKTPADYLAKVREYDPDLHADMQHLADGLPSGVTDHRDMTVGDFRLVAEHVMAIWSLAKTTREIEIDGERVALDTAALALAEQLGDKPARPAEAVGRNERLDLRMRLSGMRAALRRVEHWADARDGGAKAGPFRRFIWQPVSEAATRYRAAKAEHVGAFLALLKTVEPTLKPGKIAAPELGADVVFADRSALLHALLHTGNESNKRKLLLGYRWATENDDGSLDASRWDAFIGRLHAEGRITKTDWDFVQSTWDLLDGMKPAAQAAHKHVTGHYFDEVTAHAFETPFGTMRGGYVPALTDRLLVPEGRAHDEMSSLTAGQNSPMFPAVGRGFTKARVEDYTRPLALDLRQLPAHIDKVARFSYLGPVLRDVARLTTKNKTFTSAMNAHDPTAIESMLRPWLQRTAAQSLTAAPQGWAGRAVARVATTVRNRTGLLLMAGNVVNTMQQVTSLSVAALRVKPQHLAAGLWEYVRAPKQAAEAIEALSPWMEQRSQGTAHDIEQAIDDMVTNPNALQQAERLGTRYGYVLQHGLQNVLDRTVWLGAYREAQAAGRDDGQAVRDADAAVRMTQSSFAPEDASAVEHQGAFVRMFLTFYSYFNGQANLLATEVSNANGRPARLALVYLLGFAMPAFLADVIAKGARGELGEDDDLEADLLNAFFLSQARYALAAVPVAGQAGNAAIGVWTPGALDDRVGASPTYSAVESAVRAPRSIYRALEGDGNPKTAVRDTLTAVSLLTGLPLGPLVRPLGHLADDDADEVTLRGLVTGQTAR